MKPLVQSCMKPHCLYLLVMSGTGNSLRVAYWLKERAGEINWDVRMGSLSSWHPGSIAPYSHFDVGGVSRIALVFPTHGFTAPWPVIRAAMRMPWGRRRPVILMATRAGTKFGSWFFPGLDGTATLIPALILALKGYSIRGLAGIDMPSNWMAVHPGFRPAAAAEIIARAKPRALASFERFTEGRRRFNNPVSLATGILLAPVSLGYLVVGRILLGKLFFASNRCNGCGLCVSTCPHAALVMRAPRKPYWTWRCESCMHCMAHCPEAAIEVNYALLAVWLLVRLGVLGGAFVAVVAIFDPWPGFVRSPSAFVASMAFSILTILVLYLISWQLLRFDLFTRLVTLLTPTRFFRRYHEPDTKIRDVLDFPEQTT